MYTKIYADYSQYNQQTKMPVRSHYSLDHNLECFILLEIFLRLAEPIEKMNVIALWAQMFS